ncbi:MULTISPECIES: hypothetical protein [Streptomyces]|uniref:Amidotransferase n=2 Tax=Streptomyces TaxID=1883 RepID=A0A9X8QTE0_9ACTN|nr:MULTISPECIES: hypothetical protein [Streptomyces]AJC59040.1 hypothetical protein GZL_06470 [Streptomyces sp. 769]PNE41883.1 amidotransferase [Streptomyces noursei]QRX91761.1 hypothetical protein JNO44_13690 [Streptomyces noursei]UJB41527.1 hypothetical protein HRD51_12405 [Streptomyces sp. A1-5]WEB43102.1 hypothetical protein MOV08_30125 [Streptomyces yunnanensis]
MNGLSTVFILVGLFLLGGVYSFWKQKIPRSVIILMAIASAMCLAAGVLRLEVWN